LGSVEQYKLGVIFGTCIGGIKALMIEHVL
jgi:hypothetical protein